MLNTLLAISITMTLCTLTTWMFWPPKCSCEDKKNEQICALAKEEIKQEPNPKHQTYVNWVLDYEEQNIPRAYRFNDTGYDTSDDMSLLSDAPLLSAWDVPSCAGELKVIERIFVRNNKVIRVDRLEAVNPNKGKIK